jgi:hypothetical protein
MEFIIGFTVFLVVGFMIANICSKADKEKYKEYEFLGCAKYCGGFDNVLDRIDVVIREKNNSLFIEWNKKYNIKTLEISYSSIISIHGKSEEQITNDVTLGRIVLLGVLSLGLKKRNISNRKFFILTYNDTNSNKEQKIVFECFQAEKYVDMFNNVIKAS